MYFVIQKKHNTSGTWDTGILVKETEDDALHQFHAFMSTYAYGQVETLDYVAASVETKEGLIIKSEIDDKRTT